MIIYTRTDFAQVGTTNRGCMAVISGDQKKNVLDKISVGSQNGSVITLTRKMNDTVIDRKTPPGPAIDALCLGGQVGTAKDKLFIASDYAVRGINRKGKTFFSFETNMAETTRRMHVHGVELVLAGSKSVNHYHDCQDSNHFISTEEIHDVVSLISQDSAWGARRFTMVLACADATLKIVEGSIQAYDVKLTDTPFTITLFMSDGGHSRDLVLYGTRHGKLGLVHVPMERGSVKWEIETASQAAITSIICYPMTKSQYPDIIIGKEDGLVEVYTVDESDNPTLYGMFQCDESITGISCGYVSSWNEPDIVVCTYTGWLFALSKTNRAKTEQVPQSANFSVKVQQLRSEVEELESKVHEERQRYDEMTKKGNGPGVAFIPQFQIHDSFEFIAEHGCYNLTIELVLPIDFIIVQSHIPLKLIEVEKNASVVSEVRQNELNPWPLLASYRCQANICRIELRVRSNEGDCGVFNVFVSPKIHPKVAQIASYTIRALSSHIRIHDFDLSRPITTLSFTGTFSISEAHAWLHQLIPNIPLKCPPTDSITNNFKCVTNGGTQLQVTYSKGSAVFRSDCLTTIAIIRDRVTDETLSKQVRVEVACDLNEESIVHCLKLLDPKMTHLINLEKQKILASALKQLEANNDDVFSFLSDSNAQLLKDYDRIHDEAELMKIEDSGIITIYKNLLISRSKLNGRPIRAKLEGLEAILMDDYSLENVVEYFKKTND